MLNEQEQKTIETIVKKYYMLPVLNKLDIKIAQIGCVVTLDSLHEIMTSAKQDVDNLLEKRKISGEIKDVAQARKSVVGQIFSNCILYLLLRSKEQGELRPDIYVTDKTLKNPLLEKFTVIRVDGETQKPDMDLVLYTLNKTTEVQDCLIISLKTSLRERAGQTYKWKLLLEIATTDSIIREKYNISYECKKMPTVCFATVNFYNEINNPQHRGMFKFFDNSFIGKPIEDSSFISRLSCLVDFANQRLEQGVIL
ncbi:MAG: BsaWI family type II restriction enzyme [Thiotrichaceae bacterium]